MWNGNLVSVRVFSLAISIVSIGGCEIATAPLHSAHDAQQVQLPYGRYQIDPERNRVWFLTQKGVVVFDVSRPEKLAVSLPGWVTVDTPYGCLPDLALGPKGEAVITSNAVPTLWRIDPDTLAVTAHPLVLDSDTDKDVGFSGLVYSSESMGYFAASYRHGSLWRIDPLFKSAQKIPLSAPIPKACGLAVRSRSSRQALSQPADLCVRTPRGGWTVVFAQDWRHAYVSAAHCTDRPWAMGAVSLKGK